MYIMSDTSEKVTGRVKWFNKNAGYGFITALDGDKDKEGDIFVHHSAVHVSSDQFRYLVEGEYVNFLWTNSGSDDEEHKWHATNVTGICGGPLMCETQNESRNLRNRGDEGDNANTEASQNGRQRHTARRYRGGGPRVTDSNGVEYRLVRNNNGKSRTQEPTTSSNDASTSS